MQLQLNDLGEKLENEVRNKSEQARQRKKYEDLSTDLEGQVDRLNSVCSIKIPYLKITSGLTSISYYWKRIYA